MNSRIQLALTAIRWLITDTFRQAFASGIVWIVLAVTGVAILLCLSVSVTQPPDLSEGVRFVRTDVPVVLKPREMASVVGLPPMSVAAVIWDRGHIDAEEAKKGGVETLRGKMSLGFGLVPPFGIGRDARDAVRTVELLLATGVADVLGLLLALVWTAGFLPTFLEPSSIAVLLAKPVPRWSLLTGKFVGGIIFIICYAVLFVFGTWTALGLKTGVWDPAYLLVIPILVAHFTVFYSFSLLLAVFTRNASACVFGSLVFWFACYFMNFARHMVLFLYATERTPGLRSVYGSLRFPVQLGYWLLPKPADMGMILSETLQTKTQFMQPEWYDGIRRLGEFHPELSVLSSLAFAAILVGMAAHEFLTTDY
jgi:hypothetical protein